MIHLSLCRVKWEFTTHSNRLTWDYLHSEILSVPPQHLVSWRVARLEPCVNKLGFGLADFNVPSSSYLQKHPSICPAWFACTLRQLVQLEKHSVIWCPTNLSVFCRANPCPSTRHTDPTVMVAGLCTHHLPWALQQKYCSPQSYFWTTIQLSTFTRVFH